MKDILFEFNKRKLKTSYPNIRIHYSKYDEEIHVKIIDRRRVQKGDDFVRDCSRLNEIYNDIIYYFKSRKDTKDITPKN